MKATIKSYAEELKDVAKKVHKHPAINNMATRAIGRVLKDIATGPALYDWLAHGANELANCIVKGHPAPIYTKSYSPAAKSEPTIHGPERTDDSPQQGFAAMNQPEQELQIDHAPETNILDRMIENAQEQSRGPEMEQEVER